MSREYRANANVQLPNHWRPMAHQLEFFNYLFENGEFPFSKRAFLTWHRRAGKDSCGINGLAIASQLRKGTYWHLLPTLNQGRKVVWNGVDGQGRRIIHQAFPREMVEVTNENEMTIRLKNGSFYQVVGSDNYNTLVGANPLGVIFSEWALSDPAAWDFVRPILLENKGFAAFITTPRGKNHAYKQWRKAIRSEKWFTSSKTVRDTFRDNGLPIISEEDIESERDEGVAEEIIEQEYYCSWEGINFGSIFGRQLNKYEDHQIAFPEPFIHDSPVFTAWDIGHRDATAIWFYQISNGEVRIIDYIEGTGSDADEWLDKLEQDFPYAYGTPALPHDARNKTFATRFSARDRFIERKLTPYIVPNMSRAMGIQAARAMIPIVWFNTAQPRVLRGLEHLTSYHYEWDDEQKVFSTEPAHDEHSHGADAFRMLALSKVVIEQCNRGKTTVSHAPTPPVSQIARALNLENLFKDRENASNYRRV